MIKHFWVNRHWVTIAVEEFMVGIVVMLNAYDLDESLHGSLGFVVSPLLGLFYLMLGVVLLINALWDFYWHRIRITLIAMSGGMWVLLSVSYGLSDVIKHQLTFLPIVFAIIAMNVFLSAWQEPRHKLKGGQGY
ncbi:hypothetical protein [Leuconostoc citreum]|uniref:hypothetical protein n=1 Tax=Leuconostoc citreum TaxID=33964 RepID=UPI0032DE54CE